MKSFMSQKAYLVSMLLMSVFISALAGCGGGGGGSWTDPGTSAVPGSSAARPTVTATVPVTSTPGPTLNVPINTTITVAFSKDMAPATLTAAGAFTVTGPGVTPVAGRVIDAVTYDVASKTATFHPLAPLTGGVTYTATVKGIGTNPATDLTGNALAGKSATPLLANDYVWTFTTSLVADTTRPLVTVTVPATTTPGPTLNVPTNTAISATFNEDMLPASLTAAGAFTLTGPGATPVTAAVPAVTYVVGTRTATFHPLALLTGGVTYTATIKGLGAAPATDSAGNALAGNPALPLVANDYVWTFTAAFTTPPGNVNDLMSYGIASAGGITNTGATKINGNVVLDPNDNCNGVPVGAGDNFGLCASAPPTNNTGDLVITQTHPDTTTADAIRIQLLAKWNDISPAGTPGATVLGCGVIGSAGGGGALIGCAGNPTLPPGTYISATNSTINISGNLTLDAGGNPNAVWVIQAPSALTSEVGGNVILTGGAKASNVWWFVGSSADLKTNSIFNGNVLASAAISMGTGSTSCGRLFSGAEGFGAFTFLGNMVSVPGHPNAPLGCI